MPAGAPVCRRNTENPSSSAAIPPVSTTPTLGSTNRFRINPAIETSPKTSASPAESQAEELLGLTSVLCPFFLRSCKDTDLFRSEPHSQNTAKGQKKSAVQEIAGDSKGYYDREAKRIAVQENMSESQTLKTMIHEVAHSELHSKEVEQDEQMKKTAIPKKWKLRA